MSGPFQCSLRDLNPRRPALQAGALPTELRLRKRPTGFEPVPRGWKPCVLPLNTTDAKAE